jgi:uncharacterized membrane protein YfbV (UPF0208 family)
MIFIAISNALLVLLLSGANPLQYSEKRYYLILLALQVIFYGLAWLGARSNNPVNPSKIKKLVYIATFLVNSNLAALRGFIQFTRGKQSHIWDRIERR